MWLSIKPGDHRPSPQIDAPRARPRQARNLLVRADGDDTLAPDRYGLRDREAIVDGDDLAVREDEIRGWLLRPHLGQVHAKDNHEGHERQAEKRPPDEP